MKLLKHLDPNTKNRDSRWVFMSMDSDKIDELVDRDIPLKPYKFRVKHLKMLEKQKGDLDVRDRVRINEIAEYYVSLFANDKADGLLPSRMAFEFYNSSLFSSLSLKLQRQVTHLFDKKRDSFVALSNKKPGDMFDTEIVQATRMFRVYQVRGTEFRDKILNTAVETLQSKLVERAQDLMAGYTITGSGTTSRIDPISPATPALSYDKRFFLLEVYRLFPRAEFWLDRSQTDHSDPSVKKSDKPKKPGAQFDKLKQMAALNMAHVIEQMTDGADGEKNSALMMMFWDMLELWMEEDPTTFSGLGVTEIQKDQIVRMVERGNVAQFLGWAKSWLYAGNKVLLPMHIHALNQIKETHYESIDQDDPVDELKALAEERLKGGDKWKSVVDEIEELEKKIRDTEKEEVSKVIGSSDFLSSEKASELESKYRKAEQTQKKVEDEFLLKEAGTPLDKFIKGFEAWRTKSKSSSPSVFRSIEASTISPAIIIRLNEDFTLSASELESKVITTGATKGSAEYYKQMKRLAEQQLKDFQKALNDVVRLTRKELENTSTRKTSLTDAVLSSNEQKYQSEVDEFQAIMDGLTSHLGSVSSATDKTKTAGTSILEAANQKSSKEVENLTQRKNELEEKLGVSKREQKKIQARFDLFNDPTGNATELLGKYSEGLKKRARSGGLYAADMVALFNDDIDGDYKIAPEPYTGTDPKEKEKHDIAESTNLLARVYSDAEINGLNKDELTEEDRVNHSFKKGYKEVLTEFRKDFNDVLDELLDGSKIDDFFRDKNLLIDHPDRFSVWNKALDQLLGYDAILSEFDEPGYSGLDDYVGFYKERGKTPQIAALLDGAIAANRNKIIGLIRTGFEASSPDFSRADLKDFAAQYHRFHSSLELSDEYKQLQQDRADFEKERHQLDLQSNEIQGEVDALFGIKELEPIWQKLEPFIQFEGHDWDVETFDLDTAKEIKQLVFDPDFLSKASDPDAQAAWYNEEKLKIQEKRTKLKNDARSTEYDEIRSKLLKALFDTSLGSPTGYFETGGGRWVAARKELYDRLDGISGVNLKKEIPDFDLNLLLDEVMELSLNYKGRGEITDVLEDYKEILISGEDQGTPGKETLKEVELQLAPVKSGMEQAMNIHNQELSKILQELKDDPEGQQYALKAQVLYGLKELCPSLRDSIASADALLDYVVSDKPDFRAAYINNLLSYVTVLEGKYVQCRQEMASGNTIHANNQIFDSVVRLTGEVLVAFDVTSGAWKDNLEVLNEQHRNIPKAVQVLKNEFGLYGPDAEETAKKRYGEFREKFEAKHKAYRTELDSVLRTINKKAKEFGGDDDQFFQLFGATREDIIQVYHELMGKADGYETAAARYSDTDFWSDWMDRYKDPKKRGSALDDFAYWDDIKSLEAEMERQTKGFSDWRKDLVDQEKAINRGPAVYFRHVSIRSIIEMFKDSYELASRRVERRVERDKADLGKAIFGDTGVFGLGYEWDRKSTEEEETRVEDYKKQHKRKNMWELRSSLYDLGENRIDKDEVRALIDLLVDMGTMRWDDPMFWKVLNRLNRDRIGMIIDIDYLRKQDMGTIRDQVRTACGAIWDDYVFKGWDDSLDGKHKSAVDIVQKEFKEMEAMNGRPELLASMLRKWQEGTVDETVSPERFEGILFNAFDQAKMNGTPDQRWFFLIMAITVKSPSGASLVSPTILSRFDDSLLSRVPYFDFFTDSETSKLNGWCVPDGTKGAEQRPWSVDDFEAWGQFFGADGRYGFNPAAEGSPINSKCNEFFYNNICKSQNALSRVDRKSKSIDKEADHDDAPMWFQGMSWLAMTQALNQSSQGTDLVTQDFGASLLMGFDHSMRAAYEYIKENDAIYGEGHTEWRVQRDEALRSVSERMRVGFGALNTLKGNYHGTDRTTPLVLDDSFWDGKKEKRYKLDASDKQINFSIQELLKVSGEEMEDYNGVWDYHGSKMDRGTHSERKETKGYKDNLKVLKKIIGGDDGGDEDGQISHFSNLQKVEEVLMNYGQKYGGISGPGEMFHRKYSDRSRTSFVGGNQ